MVEQRKILIFLYNRLFDPVIQSNFWLFIADLIESGKHVNEFSVITFEDEDYPLSESQNKKLQNWQRKGLKWEKLKWHSGLAKRSKLMDLVQGFFAVLHFRLKGFRHVLSVGSIAGSFVYLYSQIIPIKRFVYCYEPHSEYMLDNAIWDQNSLQYRWLNRLEKLQVKHAEIVTSGTLFMKERIQNDWKLNYPDFYQLPTVVNDVKFDFEDKDRFEIRAQLSLSEDIKIMLYPGKFGDLYYDIEIARMFKWVHESIADTHFLVITPQSIEEVHSYFTNVGVDPGSYTIIHADYSEIHRYYSASDFGIVAVPPGPSKKFISNIKVGEYLCSGLPYLITEGVSEDYLFARKNNVGVVVKNFDENAIKKVIPEIKSFLEMEPESRRTICRNHGVSYRGLSKLKLLFAIILRNFSEID